MNKVLVAFFFLVFVSCSEKIKIKEQSKSIGIEDSELIDYLFEGATGNNPGANVLVVKNGKIVHQKSYGLANVESNIKSTPETNYRIASVSKSFTAMAIMILENQGKLFYETKLTEIFPNFPEYGNTINVRHLLTHQSGVIDYDEFIPEDRTEQMLDSDVMEGLKQVDSTYFFPGSAYRYSNSGYALLALIVEKISGNSFADFMDREIFEKLNMTNTQVFELDKPIVNRAYGYSIKKDAILFNDQSVSSAIQGDGGIYCNVLDYLKWDQALYTDKLISLEKLDQAFYDYDDNEKTDKEGYGYGWSIDYNNGTKFISHSGGTAGFETRVTRIPSLQLSVIIFNNRDGHDRLNLHRTNALISIYSDYKIPMPVEILIKKEIDQKGINQGIELYDKLKGGAKYSNEITALTFLGFEYYRLQKYDEAKALFTKTTQEYSDHFGGYYSLGLLYKKLGNFDSAIINFQKVIELGTGDEPWMLDRTRKHLKEISKKEPVPNK